ncbi:MAG: PEP/pyruvate-binding domain-containing protein, partial [Halanaerobiaceae bacterium]
MTVKINTGLPGLDGVIQGLHPGDNVVWQVDEVKDYRDFLRPFVERSLKDKKKIIYLRFAEHKALLDLQQNDITVHKLNAARGFESFAVKIYNIIKREGEGAYYIFDCLSDLLLDWAADLMIANFFTVICPYLFELNTIAYFAIMRNMHSYKTIDKIQDITQVFLNLYSSQGEYFVYPVKVQDRHSSTMFLPHVKKGKEFEPIIDSYNVSKLFLQKTKKDKDPERNLDYWDKLFLQARVLQDNEVEKRKKMMNRICNYMLGRDQKIMSLVKNNFELGDVLEINSRLIGTGFIGGKTLGMLLARKILKNDCKFTEEECLEEHDSFYIGSDVFYSYIVQNGCWEQWVKQKSENDYSKTARGLKKKLLQGEFPEEIKAQFRDMLDYYGQSPIIVRSSSILEDGFGNAFAGKYDSYFCVNQGDPEKRYDRFEEVVRKIYASTMNKDAFIYRLERGLSGCDEQMALLVQRVSGGYHNHYFFPLAAGVGFSYNNYTWKRNMDPGEGMLRLVFGLGTRAVDRTADDYPRIVALDHVLLKTVSSREDERKFSQHSIDLLDLEENEFKTCSVSRVMSELSGVDNIKMIGEKDHETNKEIEKMGIKGREAWIISFDELLSATDFSRIIKSILNILENNYHYPVDIEFTVNVNNRG